MTENKREKQVFRWRSTRVWFEVLKKKIEKHKKCTKRFDIVSVKWILKFKFSEYIFVGCLMFSSFLFVFSHSRNNNFSNFISLVQYLRSWSDPSSPFFSSLLFMNGNLRENVKFFFFRSSVDCYSNKNHLKLITSS